MESGRMLKKVVGGADHETNVMKFTIQNVLEHKAKKVYTRSGGAKSGVESYFIGIGLVLSLGIFIGVKGVCTIMICMMAFQFQVMGDATKTGLWYAIFSQKFGQATVRNANIGFLECVKPGGRPTTENALLIYHYPGWLTSFYFSILAIVIIVFNPAIAFVRLWYPEHYHGVPKSYLHLYWFFLRNPAAVQGEGPSNGDGLAAMNGVETCIYPITARELTQGNLTKPYWLKEERRPRFRDMFHDKLFCHRFFESHGAPHPKLVAEVCNHKRREIFLTPDKAPKKLVWKPRYSTMGLGVEKFEGWKNVDQEDWAPSNVPYVIEEMIVSTEWGAGEWYRMSSLWDWDEAEPKPGYIWCHRNDKTDKRIQTDILGGRSIVTSKYDPFVGPTGKGRAFDTRNGTSEKLNPDVDKALSKAIDLQMKMHKNLGKELHSIGWDVMVVKDQPIFIEFNINNGFFVGDHSMEELELMVKFYERNILARLPHQVVDFNPEKDLDFDIRTKLPSNGKVKRQC